MSEKIEQETRRQIAVFLPAAIEKTLQSYQDFMAQGVPPENEKEGASKVFSDHHRAGKMALSHLELLLKLARWADLPGSDLIDSKGLKTQIEHAAKIVELGGEP